MIVHVNQKRGIPFVAMLVLVILFLGMSYPALSQDSAFLECASLTDRDERLQCLDRALTEATEGQVENPGELARETVNPEPAAEMIEPVQEGPQTVETVAPAAPVLVEQGVEQERLQQFGERQARLEVDEEGNEELHDTVVELQKIRDMWRITLSSGQIWAQTYPRRFNLREGDAVVISRGGFASGFRLSAEGLGGYIRVEKVQ